MAVATTAAAEAAVEDAAAPGARAVIARALIAELPTRRTAHRPTPAMAPRQPRPRPRRAGAEPPPPHPPSDMPILGGRDPFLHHLERAAGLRAGEGGFAQVAPLYERARLSPLAG